MSKTIGIFVGSLRKGSYNRTIAEAIASFLPAGYEGRIIEIGDLPLYNPDLDDAGTPPAAWQRLRDEARPLDGVLFVTPEYNRSVPAVLKNALDVGSRPYGQSVWDGKPGAVASVSPGGIAGFGANHHLRQSLVFLNVLTLQQPEAYIGNVMSFVDENGTITSEDTKGFLKSFAEALANWVDLIGSRK